MVDCTNLNHLGTIQCKIKQKYGVILKQSLEGGMKNFAFQNRVLQRDRVLERRVLEREYCIIISQISNIHNPRELVAIICDRFQDLSFLRRLEKDMIHGRT